MPGHECYHCKQWVARGEAHDCWTTTEAALTRELSEDLQDAWERLRETAASFGDQRIYASHKSIMFSRKACYFFVRPKRRVLEIVFFLGRAVKAPQIRRAVAASRSKIAHIVHVRHRDEVEAPITNWLQEAYETSNPLANTSDAVAKRTKGTKPVKRAKRTRARNKTSARLGLVLAVIGATATIAAQSPVVAADTVITLERTRCFGLCPAYAVSIDAAGTVTYHGKAHVRVSGRQQARIPAPRVAELLETAKRLEFFTLADEYSSIRHPDGTSTFVTDLPSTIVTIASGGRQKRVVDYLGAPAGLRELEQQIDDAANTRRWVRIDEDTLRELAREGRLPGTTQRAAWLMAAAINDEVGVIKTLIDLGLKPNQIVSTTRMSPLMFVRSGAAARLLLAAGADPRQRDSGGGTPLAASATSAPEVTRALLDAGVGPDEGTNSLGQRPLLAAACAGNATAVELLLAAGADPSSSGTGGESPLQCARRGKRNAEFSPPASIGAAPLFVADFDRVIALLELRVKSPA